MRLRLFVTFRWGRCSTGCWGLKLVSVRFWTRAGTWGIAYSQEPAGDSAASCLPATAYPAVVPALLSGI